MVVEALGIVFAAATAIAKLVMLLEGVEDELLVFREVLEHDFKKLEFVHNERSRKLHLLDSYTLDQIDSVFHDCQRACNIINELVHDPLDRMKRKGFVNFGQRLDWVFHDSQLAKAWENYRQTTHISLITVWSLCMQQNMNNLPSPDSTYISAIQPNEHDHNSFQSTSKPQPFTIRKKSSAPQIGEIIFEGLSPRWPISLEENASASLGHGVNAGLCAKPLPTKAHESNKIMLSEREIGSMLARREIAFSRRRVSGSDSKKV